MDDDAIRTVLKRLARPDSSGGHVIERAAILAEGADFPAIMAWIVEHAGVPEASAAAAPRRGLHGSQINAGGETATRSPRRFVLPADALA